MYYMYFFKENVLAWRVLFEYVLTILGSVFCFATILLDRH